MTFTRKYLFFMMIIVLAALVLTMACGKKGPPLPPEKPGNILAIPGNLAYTLEGNQVTLTWTHTLDPINARLAPEAFIVYRAVKDIKACQGCPFVFKSAGQVSMPAMVFQQVLEPGPQYYFRVQAIGKNGSKSDYSQTILIEFE